MPDDNKQFVMTYIAILLESSLTTYWKGQQSLTVPAYVYDELLALQKDHAYKNRTPWGTISPVWVEPDGALFAQGARIYKGDS